MTADTSVAISRPDSFQLELLMSLALIGAAFCVGGTLLLAFMWLSKRGENAASNRSMSYTRDTVDRRFDPEPLRRT